VQHDPALGDEVLEDVAESFADVLVMREEEDHPGLARASRAMILRTIDPMPEPWRSRILAVPVLANKLKLKRGGTIVLRPDVSFAAADFYAAVTKAFAEGGTRLKTVAGAMTRLEVQGTNVTVVMGTDRFVLTDPDLGLAQSDPTARRAAYAVVARMVDLLPAEVEPFWTELESLDLGARFLLLNQRETDSYHAHLERLGAELQGARRFEADLLAPLPPAAILRYLRLPPDATVADLAGAFDRLEGELGLFEALKRTAGLPALYSAASNQRLSQAIVALDGGEQGHAPSPLYGLKSALALKEVDGPARERAISDALEAFENFSGLFLAILRWSARKVRHDPLWQGLPADLRQALLWLHADLVTAHLAITKTEPAATEQLFEQLDRFGIWGLLAHADKPAMAVAGFETAVGLKVWLAGLLAADLGNQGLSEDAKARLRAMAGQQNEGEWMPQFIALARPDTPPFGSMMQAIAALREAEVLTTTTVVAGCDTPQAMLEQFLKEGATQDGGDVSGALPIFRIDDIAEDAIPAILAVVARFKPFERFTINTVTYNMWLSLMGSLYGRLDDTAAFVALMRERLAAAQTLTEREDAFEGLAEAAFHFAVTLKGDGAARLEALQALLDQLGHVASELAPNLRRLLSGLITHVPAQEGARLWDAVLKWRRS
jgi:hypothetical protein